MSNSNHRRRLGIGAVLAGSALLVSPLAASAAVCLDNGSIGQCEAAQSNVAAGGSGQEATVRSALAGRYDAKDHPNYGQVTPAAVDADTFRSNYESNLANLQAAGHLPEAAGRLDAKDHPNYGPATRDLLGIDVPIRSASAPEGRTDAKDHPNYGPVVRVPAGGARNYTNVLAV